MRIQVPLTGQDDNQEAFTFINNQDYLVSDSFVLEYDTGFMKVVKAKYTVIVGMDQSQFKNSFYKNVWNEILRLE